MRVECKVSPTLDDRWVAVVTDGHIFGDNPAEHMYFGATADDALLSLRRGIEAYERMLKKQRMINQDTITSIIDIDV